MELMQYLPEKSDDFASMDVGIRMEPEKETDALPSGCHTHDGHHGDLLMMAGAMAHDGGLAAQTPRATQEGCHHDAAFIQKHQVSLQPAGFFLARGQTVHLHVRMYASSRSAARRSGRCGDKPSECNRRPT